MLAKLLRNNRGCHGHRIQSAALIAVSARGEMQDVGDNVDTSSNTVSSPLT
jgi:hypothetical protein